MSLLEIALSRYGTRYDPVYESELGLVVPKGSNWCGLFIGWCMIQIGLEIPDSPQVARRYLKIGESVENPQVGDLVIFWRESKKSWKGHVGIFVREDHEARRIYCLGGNQSNLVNITAYDSRKVLGFRRLV
ncbi:MAG: TIGR02594 family protein [Pseudobacteriovorax sp.]|nr:TIGR02594 family protein [Pseudobacteriovorax sp.]